MLQIAPLDWQPEIVVVEQQAHALAWSERLLQSCFGSGYKNWGAWVDQHLAAFLIVQEVLDEWTVMNIATAVRFQRQGVATQLIQHLQKQASQQQAIIWLEVRASNEAAIQLYLKCGFVERGKRARYYRNADDTREDAIVMSWQA
ncbi:ribosomal protein S18-alanine N-acetyltransferase [Pseudidiomarina sp. PP-1MA]|uniref:[Ribosomal protein bS18]-alanine N-acetyltransferase n=1 Tax=Pseudidiomarina sp. PP-1MA TaxID=3237706 RepID=A0AB39X6Y8_9GAMM